MRIFERLQFAFAVAVITANYLLAAEKVQFGLIICLAIVIVVGVANEGIRIA
jgi:hypothetical protein